MPRPPRLDHPGAHHHVFNRSRSDVDLFVSDEECLEFLDLLSDLPARFGVGVVAFCLMPNHYHLMLRSHRGNLSVAMAWLQSEFSGRVNRRRGLKGPLFRTRFGNRLVEDEAWWRFLPVYLHLNPVKARLIAHPDRFLWSSHPYFAGRHPLPEWLEAGELLAELGGARGYAEYLAEVMMGRQDAPEGFEAGIEALSSSIRVGEGGAAAPEWRPVDEEEALAQVAAVTGVEGSALLAAPRGARRPERWLAMGWLREVSGLSNVEIARRFGTSPAVVAVTLRRLRRCADPVVVGWLEALRAGVPR